jgi:uncharacterized surface protein with fasciclin (FAS1) repeats
MVLSLFLDPGELTLVTPTNLAFAKLPADVVKFVTSTDG